MDEPTALGGATRAALRAVIAAQQPTIAALSRRIADLERRLGSSGGTGMPGTKPASATRAQASGRPRKRRDQGAARARSATPTHRVTHAAGRCPDCPGPLAVGGWCGPAR